jgi:hypothetical protein
MANSNFEVWEKALLPMPELNPSDSISNKGNSSSYDNSCEPELGLYAKLKRDNDDWGLALQKQREMRTKTLLWIQNLVSSHPEGIDDTTYALAQPSVHLEGDYKKEGLPRPVVVPRPHNKPKILLPLTQPTSLARNREVFEADIPEVSSPKSLRLKLRVRTRRNGSPTPKLTNDETS